MHPYPKLRVWCSSGWCAHINSNLKKLPLASFALFASLSLRRPSCPSFASDLHSCQWKQLLFHGRWFFRGFCKSNTQTVFLHIYSTYWCVKLVEHSSLNDSTWVVWQTWDWQNQLWSSRHLVGGQMMKMVIMKTIRAKLTLCDSPGVQTLTGSLTTFVSHCSSSLQSRWSFWLVNYYSAQAKKDPILSLPIRKHTLFIRLFR